MRYDALLLDADDTLLDFTKSEEAAFSKVARQFGLPEDAARYSRYHAINACFWKRLERGEIDVEQLTVRRFEELFAAEGVQVDCVAFNREYRASLADYAFTVDGAVETVRALAPRIPLYIVTNGLKAVQTRRLHDSGLFPYFRGVFTSEELGVSKPHPAFFEAVLTAIGVTDRRRVLICGDSLTSDIRGGKQAGIDTCWYCPHGRAEGEGEDRTYTISDLRELPALLED